MLSEDDLEQQCLQWFAEQGWEVLHGPDIAPDGDNPLRASFHDVFLRPVMLEQLQTINPDLPVSVLEEVILRITRPKARIWSSAIKPSTICCSTEYPLSTNGMTRLSTTTRC
ncbi:DEAD/DEAH box helicase [Salmonella enterica subsp. enterica]|nr:DEAD/DEAH box helicase [Salmonella enterica subsp. enterica] [Salmonella enterica subsp. enterica serovar Menston]